MINFLRASLTLLLLTVNTLIWSWPIIFAGIIKWCLPWPRWRTFWTRIAQYPSSGWVWGTTSTMRLTKKIDWKLEGAEDLSPHKWYLVISNHQQWADSFILLQLLGNRIPVFRFFAKKVLYFFPLLGQVWWTLDFPFMRRYTADQIQKNPELRKKDLLTTQRACEMFRRLPTTIISYPEGTRFTQRKHDMQKSPYMHLLKPRAGGVAYVLNALGEQLHYILDMTIYYIDPIKGFWDFLGRQSVRVKVMIHKIKVTPDLIGDYQNDSVYREHIKSWLESRWAMKDAELEKLQQNGIA
jgi:1-acyl-sn-glycerol-3-phosphate acyltransferase